MIKFLATRDGRPTIGLGLSRGNCEKLLEGKPISIDLRLMILQSPIKLSDATILIFAGETEAELLIELDGYIGPLPEPKTHDEEN